MRQFYRPTGEERHWVVVSVPDDAAPPGDWVPLDTSPARRIEWATTVAGITLVFALLATAVVLGLMLAR